MGRKRGFGQDDSSDDDFKPPGDAGSPVFSRLKRKRRPSSRNRLDSVSPSEQGSQKVGEEKSEVILIPESLEEEENVVSETPERPSKAKPGDEEVDDIVEDASVKGGADEAAEDLVQDAIVQQADAAQSEENDGSEASADDEPKETENVVRRVTTVNRSSFDESDSEPDPSEDEASVYNSADDSPDDDDLESDFAPSPVKAPRKKAKPKPPSRGSAPKGNPKRAASTPVRKPLAKSAKKAVLASSTPATTSNVAKKRLGSRIPSKLSGLGKSNGSSVQRQRPAAPSKIGSAVYRAGLSRNASIPRLHSYLPRQ